MKAIKEIDNELYCIIEDAIFYDNDTFRIIKMDNKCEFQIDSPKNIELILENGWSNLYPKLKKKNQFYDVVVGETSWGGTGFVAVRNLKNGMFKWVMHLSTLNNPINLFIDEQKIELTSDLYFPKDFTLIIPIDSPEELFIK